MGSTLALALGIALDFGYMFIPGQGRYILMLLAKALMIPGFMKLLPRRGYSEVWAWLCLISAIGPLILLLLPHREGSEIARMRSSQPPPCGLGGWLILAAIGLALVPIRSGMSLYSGFVPLVFDDQLRTALPGALIALLIFEGLAHLAFVAYAVLLLYLFLHRSPRFPKLYIGIWVATLAFKIVDFALLSLVAANDPDDQWESVRAIGFAALQCAAWIPYILRSRRVRATFLARDDSGPGPGLSDTRLVASETALPPEGTGS